MHHAALKELIAKGEGATLEFKRCGNVPESDVFESICSFANREGGTILLGVSDDGTVSGVNPREILSIQRNVANVVANPNCFNVSPSVDSECIDFEGKSVIKLWVPMGPSVYRYKNRVYDRIFDADVVLKSDEQISALYMRKKNVYTERRVYPHVSISDLRQDMLKRMRTMIGNHRSDHPWLELDDDAFLRVSRLLIRDEESGVEGFNLACIMLLGSDGLISNIVPAYRTEALLQRADAVRYDDRLTVCTNLLDSYDQLVAFAEKWLPDPFYLEGDQRRSIRSIIVRELVANCLIHRELTSPFVAKLVVDAAGIRTRNASRSLYSVNITPDNLNPTPKNPIIANIFTQVGLAESLGSGTQYLFKYSKLYSGQDPVLRDGDFFDAFVPVPDYLSDTRPKGREGGGAPGGIAAVALRQAETNGSVTSSELARLASVSPATARRHLNDLVRMGVLEKTGSTRAAAYHLV